MGPNDGNRGAELRAEVKRFRERWARRLWTRMTDVWLDRHGWCYGRMHVTAMKKTPRLRHGMYWN